MISLKETEKALNDSPDGLNIVMIVKKGERVGDLGFFIPKEDKITKESFDKLVSDLGRLWWEKIEYWKEKDI